MGEEQQNYSVKGETGYDEYRIDAIFPISDLGTSADKSSDKGRGKENEGLRTLTSHSLYTLLFYLEYVGRQSCFRTCSLQPSKDQRPSMGRPLVPMG